MDYFNVLSKVYIAYYMGVGIKGMPVEMGMAMRGFWSDARATRNFTWDVKFNKTENSLT